MSVHVGSTLSDVGARIVSIDLSVPRTSETAERGIAEVESSPSPSPQRSTARLAATAKTLSAEFRLLLSTSSMAVDRVD